LLRADIEEKEETKSQTCQEERSRNTSCRR